MVCDICDAPGRGTIVSVANFKKAVRNGFNPIPLMKPHQVSSWTLSANVLNKPDAYSCWKEEALSGSISHTDWNVCAVCMSALKPYLSSSDSSGGQASSSSSNSGCYIATACYGDYNAPEVLVFRHFRDNYLLKSKFGISVVNVYYKYSPFLAEKLKKYCFINDIVRKVILNPIFKFLCFLNG